MVGSNERHATGSTHAEARAPADFNCIVPAGGEGRDEGELPLHTGIAFGVYGEAHGTLLRPFIARKWLLFWWFSEFCPDPLFAVNRT
jgi:hypothetical protein